MINVFIIGSKGIPAQYGGFETFVEKLTINKQCDAIKYHVACMAKDSKEFEVNDARCFNVSVPEIGSAKAVLYDLLSMKACIKYIRKNKLENCIIYVLACRIGPFIHRYKKQLKKLNVKLYVNPDGHEWKRSKWNRWIKAYWKLSEKLMVKNADLLICDSMSIENYIHSEYQIYRPKTVFISYGAEIEQSELDDNSDKLSLWYKKHDITKDNYYLIVGRFVPENNYEAMIREFMNSNSKKDLVIITNVQKNKFYQKLLKRTHFDKDKRIKFVGTLYDGELLKKVRENAFAYIHGHEVGGTNPSLLEALISTKLNILLDVGFNREVARNGALYFTKSMNSLAHLINETEKYSEKQILQYGAKAKQRIFGQYSWKKIISEYEELLTDRNIQVS